MSRTAPHAAVAPVHGRVGRRCPPVSATQRRARLHAGRGERVIVLDPTTAGMTGAVDRRPAGTAPVGPVLPTTSRLRPLGCDAVRLTGGFWGERQRRNGSDRSPRAGLDRQVRLAGNLRLAARGDLGARARRGREFSDSEVFKLAEAMAWESPAAAPRPSPT